MASNWFEESYYLSAKAAYNNANKVGGLTTWTGATVQAGLSAAGLTPEQHYTKYGWTEGLAPNPYYVESQYVDSKVKDLNATKQGGRTDWTSSDFYAALGGTNAFNHYLAYGAFEKGVEPSLGFNDDTYYTKKAEYNNTNKVNGKTDWTADSVSAAFKAANLTPIGHYEQYGKTEGFYTPTPSNPSVTLTTGVDIVAGNAFSAPLVTSPLGNILPTLNNGDNLTGQGTAPILTAMLNGAGGTTSITSTGVETFSLQNLGTGAQTVNGTITGLKNVDITQATVATIVAGLQSKLETVALTNTNGQNFTATVANAALSGTADAITTTLNGTTDGTVTLQSVSGSNGYEIFNVKSATSANTIANITDGGTNTSATTLNLSGNQALTINSATNTGGIVDVLDTKITTIDASNMAPPTVGGTVPGVTIGGILNAAADISRFAPDSTTAGSVVITGSAGADSFFINTANAGSQLKITGGDGTDRVTFTGASGIATMPVITGVEELRITDGGRAFAAGTAFSDNLTSVSGVTKVILDGSTTNVTTGVLTLTGLAGAPTIQMNGTKSTTAPQFFNGLTYTPTGSTTLSMNIGNQGVAMAAGAGQTVGTLNLNGVTSLALTAADISATGTTTLGGNPIATLTTFSATAPGNLTTGTLGSNSVTSANFSGVTGVVNTTISQGASGLITVAGTGANTVVMGGTGANTTLDASGGTGNQILTGSGVADIIKGGSGNDTITGGLTADTITTNGGIDTVVYGSNTQDGPFVNAFADTAYNATTAAAAALAVNGTATGTFEVIQDIATGDRINTGNTAIAAAATAGRQQNNEYTWVSGTWNAATSTFTIGATIATGPDSLLMIDTQSTGALNNNQIVLVGVTNAELTAATLSAGILTF